MEHTAKNVLIRALRQPAADSSVIARAADEYARFRQRLGVESFHLETALGEPFRERLAGGLEA